jgi:hypothetical protein
VLQPHHDDRCRRQGGAGDKRPGWASHRPQQAGTGACREGRRADRQIENSEGSTAQSLRGGVGDGGGEKTLGYTHLQTCPSRKSYPRVSMMQA